MPDLTVLHALAIVAAGLAAGTINTIVGSGSLITFPTLIALGYPPLLANVSNTVGLVPGSVSGAIGYRSRLRGQHRRALVLSALGLLGGVSGGVLLLVFPDGFETVVPWLVLVAVVLVIVQPFISVQLASRGREAKDGIGGPLLWLGVTGTGVYGGYFGAAQGVILIALLALGIDEDLQRLNAVKNVITAVVNAAAAVLFIAVTDVAWSVAGLLAIGAVVGGQLGALIGTRLPSWLLRAVIVVAGTAVAVQLLLSD